MKEQDYIQDGTIFKRLGLDRIADDQKIDLTGELGYVVLSRVADRLERLLTPQQALEVDSLLRGDDPDALALLEQYVPDYPDIVLDEVETLRSELLGAHDDIMKKLSTD